VAHPPGFRRWGATQATRPASCHLDFSVLCIGLPTLES